MNKEIVKIKRAINKRGFCATYVVTTEGVKRMSITEVTATTISGHNYGTKEDEVVALDIVTALTILG